MTYDARERSTQDGSPVELYTFTVGATVYRYTSADDAQTVDSEIYTRAPLARSKIQQTSEQNRLPVQIACPRDFPIADLFRVAPPTEVITVVIRRYHRADAEVAVIWSGRVLNVDWRGAQAGLNCEPVSSSLRRTGLRRLYGRACPHVLYSSACGVVRASHSTDTTVSAVSGLTLTVAALASKPYAGGFVEWVQPSGNIERRFISSFSGLVLTLSQPFQGIAPGEDVTVSPGCNHTTATCSTVYSNLPNYGGFPFIPTKNPFDGDPVY